MSTLLGLGEGEARPALRQLALVFVSSAALVLLKAAQGGIFLAAYPRTAIPWALAVSALALASMSALTVAGAARLGPVRLAGVTLILAPIACVVCRLMIAAHLHAAPFATYVVVETTAGLVLIQTWSVVSGTVDPRSARRILPIAGVGAGVAWTLGGLLVPHLVKHVGAPGLLVLGPFLLLGAAALVRMIARMDLPAASLRAGAPTGLFASWRAGLSLVARVRLLRVCLVLSVLALLAEQLMDVQLLAAARERLTTQAEITTFFGHFYGVTSAIGLAFQLLVSSRLLARLGAVRSLLVTPAITVLAAVVALLAPGFWAVVILRGSDRTLKGALFSSAMEQTQTPVPILQRAQARALSRGVLAPLAYATCALALAALPDGTDLRWLSALTLVLSGTLLLVIALGLRRAYVSALRRAIDDRHLHLDAPVDDAAVGDLDAQAAFLVAKDLASEDEGRALLAAELLVSTHRPLAVLLLPRGLDHASSAVRVATVEGLARIGATGAEGVATLLTDDPAPDVRRAAARALASARNPGAEARARLVSATDDSDPRVRAEARVALARTEEPAGIARGAGLVPFLRDPDPFARLAALDAIGPGTASEPSVLSALRDLLADDDLAIRLAALETAGRIRARGLLADVGPLLADARTTEGAIAHLVRWGRGALDLAAASVRYGEPRADGRDDEPLARLLAHDDATVRERATVALARMSGADDGTVLPLRVVEPLLEREVRAGYRWLSLLAGVAHDDGTPDWEIAPTFAFLGRELELRFRASRARVLGLLSLFASRRLTNSVEAGMRRPAPGPMEAQVAELLETALPARLARTVVPLFDRLTLKERIREARRVELFDPHAMDDPLGWIVAQGDQTLRVCAMLTYGDRAREQHPDIHAEDGPLIPLFERMRFLRSVPLFDELLGDDLRSVAEIVEMVEPPAGTTVFSKGDPGEDMYVIVSGKIAIKDGAAEIASLGPREFFGELSVIDREARSASAIAVEPTQLLRLRAADLGELMARRPHIQEEILLVVVRRLRALNARVAQ